MQPFICIFLVSNTLSAQNPADTTLSHQTRQLKEVVVEGSAGKGKDRIGYLSISGGEINKRPALLGEHDVIKALHSTSGVVAGTEGFAGLYVRGGETDQNLYLIDGLPLQNVYHFGGLFSTFCTSAIDRVDFYKGAFPSVFGERASSIVDVALKRPDLYKTHGSFSIGLISGQLYLTTPVKKGSSGLSVALRRTWFDVFSAPVLAVMNASDKSKGKKTIFHYNFTDLMLKFSATDHKRNDFSLLLFYGQDDFKLGKERFDNQVTSGDRLLHRDINNMSWGNWGAALGYTLSTQIGDLHIEPFISKAFAKDTQDNADGNGGSGVVTSFTEMRPSVLQAGMRENFTIPVAATLDVSVGMQQTWFDYNVGNPIAKYTGVSIDPSSVTSRFKSHSKNGLLSAFADVTLDLPDIMQASVGVRGSNYLSNRLHHYNLEPRANLKVSLPYEASLSVGYSRVTQYAQQVSSNYIYLPSDAWLPTASYAKPLVADIYSVGYYRTIKKDFNVKGELWWKEMHDIAEFKPNISNTTLNMAWHDKLTSGKGWAYGLDLETEGKYDKLSWTVAYGLMWNWRKIPGINSGHKYPAKFDNRHKIDVNLGWQINERMELTGNWTYMTGNRLTLALYNIAPPDIVFPDSPFLNPLDHRGDRGDGIDYFENRNNVRMPSFHRLNLNLSIKGRLRNKLTYQWDFGLYNAYWRLNPFTVVKNYVDTEWKHDGSYRKFHSFSLFPILPSVSYTLNF